MAFIVSANYRNRGSKYRWLIRDASEPAEKARACKAVTAKAVRMIQTSQEPGYEVESGFNCSVVAVCDEAAGENFEGEELRLRFDRYGFKADGVDGEIKQLNELRLEADGGMHGTLARG